MTPESSSLHVLVVEAACASGQSPEGRILDPIVEYQATRIRITIWIRRLPGTQTCQGNFGYPTTVELSQPVGARTLVDGNGLNVNRSAEPTAP
jgi:hypothetical protein